MCRTFKHSLLWVCWYTFWFSFLKSLFCVRKKIKLLSRLMRRIQCHPVRRRRFRFHKFCLYCIIVWFFLIFFCLFLFNGLFWQNNQYVRFEITFIFPILILMRWPTNDASATSSPIKNVKNLKCVSNDRWYNTVR